MAKPNPSPKIQKKIPIMSKRWPSMPRKVTDERSGSFRLASPLTCSGCASAAEAKTVRKENASATKPIVLGQRDAKLADQMRMVIPPNLQLTEYNGSKASLRGKICAPGTNAERCRTPKPTAQGVQEHRVGGIGPLMQSACEWELRPVPGRLKQEPIFIASGWA